MNTMRFRLSTFFALLLVLASGLGALADSSPVFADDQPVKITVKVTDAGYVPNNIEIEQGKVVELTFVWDSPAHPLDEHIIVISGYKLESGRINSDHKETTVKFIATQSGTFAFQCDLMCDTHDLLQKGQITVKPAAGGGAAALQPSKLVIDPVTGVVIKGGTVSIAAQLVDKDGQPIPKAEVRFYAEQQFLGRTGLIEIGIAKTGTNGLASAVYHPTTPDAEKIVAKFAGVGLYDATEQTLQLVGSAQFGPAAGPNTDDTLHGIKGGAHLALVLVIAGVWLTFGFIAFQAWGISRVRNGGRE
jgi:hypothetical protein